MLLGMLLVNSPAFAHGHHAHGAPMTEVEQKRQRACLMTLMYAIARSPTGMVCGNPSILIWSAASWTLSSGKGEEDPEKRLRILSVLSQGYATNVETIGIEMAL